MNDELKKYVKYKISISKIKHEEDKIINKNRNFISKKIGLVACACLIMATSGVFAKDIENFIKIKFGLGNGVDTAVENGYISNIDEEVDFINSKVSIMEENSKNCIDTLNTGIRINNFVMTDFAISLNIEIKFDDKIKQYKNFDKKINGNIDYENFGNINLIDLFILDEENKLIYAPTTQSDFKDFCAKHNLKYEYLQFNESYLNSVAKCNIQEINSDNNTVKMTYIIQTNNEMPKSKQLKLFFNKISFDPKKDTSQPIYLLGNWLIDLDVPEIMYNRTDNSYNVISCENKNFNIYTAKVTETGFEIGINISNIEEPIPNKELIDNSTGMPYIFNSREELLAVNSDENFEKMYIEYNNKSWPVHTNGTPAVNWLEYTDGCYVKNSNGEKFICSNSPSRKQISEFLDGNIYNYYETFDMTKFDATNEITVFIELYGKTYKIELEKIK